MWPLCMRSEPSRWQRQALWPLRAPASQPHSGVQHAAQAPPLSRQQAGFWMSRRRCKSIRCGALIWPCVPGILQKSAAQQLLLITVLPSTLPPLPLPGRQAGRVSGPKVYVLLHSCSMRAAAQLPVSLASQASCMLPSDTTGAGPAGAGGGLPGEPVLPRGLGAVLLWRQRAAPAHDHAGHEVQHPHLHPQLFQPGLSRCAASAAASPSVYPALGQGCNPQQAEQPSGDGFPALGRLGACVSISLCPTC